MDSVPTVYVVDDDQQARESICALVGSMGVSTRGFASAEEFLRVAATNLGGCLVTDIRMRGMSGIELLDELSRKGIRIPVIVLTAYARTPMTVRAMRAGAMTLLDKPCENEDLWDAIRKALAWDEARRTEQTRHDELRRRLDSLTNAEREVMDLVVAGQANKTIAQTLGISLRTVEGRRHEILRKMQAGSIAELVRMVVEALQAPGAPHVSGG